MARPAAPGTRARAGTSRGRESGSLLSTSLSRVPGSYWSPLAAADEAQERTVQVAVSTLNPGSNTRAHLPGGVFELAVTELVSTRSPFRWFPADRSRVRQDRAWRTCARWRER